MKYQPRKLAANSESRAIWRSRLDKPVGPGIMVTLIPTLIMCVFLIMAAPYLKSIAVKFFEYEKESVILNVEMAEDVEYALPPVPPPNPDVVAAQLYRKELEAQGFDWRTKPTIELPEETRPEIQKEIKPVEVELTVIPNVELEPFEPEPEE